jgi:ribosomal protein S18 acetylase RimI-like enzyme
MGSFHHTISTRKERCYPMPRQLIVPFTADHLTQAGELLAARHRRERTVLPDLPAYHAEAAGARTAVAARWQPHTSGAAAFDGERMLGFLFGDPVVDTQRGRTAWIHLAGHALAPQVDAELYRDLYAAAGPAWLAQGCFDHFVMLTAADPAVLAAWFALGFGKEQAHGLCRLPRAAAFDSSTDPAIQIRLATAVDKPVLRELAPLLSRHFAAAPCWGASLPERVDELRGEYESIVDEDEAIAWLAEVDGRVAGFQVYYPLPMTDDNPLIPEQCAMLSVAGTRAAYRGRGINRALTRHGLADLVARGYQVCETDWRVANLEADRLWPRQGFRPAVFRLGRKIDPRIAWATGPEI